MSARTTPVRRKEIAAGILEPDIRQLGGRIAAATLTDSACQE